MWASRAADRASHGAKGNGTSTDLFDCALGRNECDRWGMRDLCGVADWRAHVFLDGDQGLGECNTMEGRTRREMNDFQTHQNAILVAPPTCMTSVIYR